MRGSLRKYWPEVAWAAFALANLVTIVALSKWETIPFHFIWVSLTLVYGIRVWGVRSTSVVLALVMVLTGVALLWTVLRGHERLDEVAEVPLMAAMFVAMVWNARRRQAAVEEAERAARTEHVLLERQREFVRDASHELRTPITVARGHLDLARASVPGGLDDDLAIVADELDRLSTLSERLLLLAAVDHPAFLSIRDLDVAPFLEEMRNRWCVTAERRWRVDVDSVVSVAADRQRLAVALDALIENAIDATDAGDEIRLTSFADGEWVVIEVADTGSGMPAGEQARVFQRFARVDPGRERESGGTGLGLAIVKGIVGAHRGSVSIASEPGHGTLVRLELPGDRPALGGEAPGEVAS